MTPDLLASLQAHGCSPELERVIRRAVPANWRRRHDRLYRRAVRRDLAILRWARDHA
jgi:hypothetical protein